MKCLIRTASAFLLFFPIATFAGWQVAKPQTAMSPEPFFQAANQPDTSFVPKDVSVPHSSGHIHTRAAMVQPYPSKFANLGPPAAVYAISVSGSLKENIERIMERYHWKVIWKAPYDFNFDGRITGGSLPNVMERLLKPFPLQGKLYMSNRTMVVVARSS